MPSIDNNIKMGTSDYIDKMLKTKINYHTLKVVVLPISNYQVALPKNYRRLVQVAASSNKHVHGRKGNWRSEVIANIEKTNNCYEVRQRLCKCPDSKCSCTIDLSIDDFERGLGGIGETVADGGKFELIKYYHYGYEIDEHGHCKSPIHRHYYLMQPSQSNLFGLKQQCIENCINFDIQEKAGSQYEFKMEPGKIITNIREGLMLLSYYGLDTDSEGFTMFPRDPSLVTAIKAQALLNIYLHLFRTHKTKPYQLLVNEHKLIFKEADMDAKLSLNELNFDSIVLAVISNKHHSNFEKTFQAQFTPGFPDKVRHLERKIKF